MSPQLYSYRPLWSDGLIIAAWDTATLSNNQIIAKRGAETFNILAQSLEPWGDPTNEERRERQELMIERDRWEQEQRQAEINAILDEADANLTPPKLNQFYSRPSNKNRVYKGD